MLTWEYELGSDSTDDPAVWIWVFVNDATAQRADFTEMTTQIRRKIRDALSSAGIERWPYINFRTSSEQRAL